ncbi:hypothetical protein [Streptomyces sp. NPDC006875]|uniref:hypothetical protein n=1 Tax=Streptomyces sp. NPDC006875 TaxID=3154781 RepID=UPI0033DBAF6E
MQPADSETPRSLTQDDPEREAAAPIVLHAVALYEAAAFPPELTEFCRSSEAPQGG